MTTKKTGRPTKYDPKYCEMLIEHMAGGLSYESFAGLIEVSRECLYDWEKANPAFFHAKKLGAEKNLLYWEKQGEKGLWDEITYNKDGKPISKRSLNSTVWIFSMKNRHRWKDRQEIDAKVQANVLTEMPREEILEKAKKAIKVLESQAEKPK